MKIRALITTCMALTVIGSSSLTVMAEDTSLEQLNAAKQKVADLQSERAAFGNEITAYDFIKWHAETNNDTETTAYIQNTYNDVKDITSDESLDDLSASIQYVIDTNTLRKAGTLEAYQISDELMLKADSELQTTTASASSDLQYFTEAVPAQSRTVLSKELSLVDTKSIGIAEKSDHTVFEMILGTTKTSYDASSYQDSLKLFVQKYITDYQTAVTALDTAQKNYDASQATAAPTAESTSASENMLTASSTPAATATAAATASADTATPAATAASTESAVVVQSVGTSTPKQRMVKYMYRLYNPNSGEHFYTSNASERNHLVDVGWNYEGIGWKSPTTSSTPVFRMYNSVAGEHHYTTSTDERDYLVQNGWSYEGIGWYSDDEKTYPVYREYNPNQYACNHNYSPSAEERDYLVSLGWQDEGICWYGAEGVDYIDGIDISEHNGDIDLTNYRDGFVIIRVGYSDTEDAKFTRNVAECERLGIPYGVYLYSYAMNASEALEEAKFVLSEIKDCKLSVGVWFDMEDADGYKSRHNFTFTADNVNSICKTFCSAIRAAGYHVGIYASKTWWDSYITDCGAYDKWLAWWGMNDGSFTDHSDSGAQLHQYTSALTDPVSGKNVDHNKMYVDPSYFLN